MTPPGPLASNVRSASRDPIRNHNWRNSPAAGRPRLLRPCVLLETARMILNANQLQRYRTLVGLFAAFSLSATAEAQTIGVPETPENPQLPGSVPASINPTPPT